ncbi:MAG: hypothetical protein ACYTF1_02570 [Planctomycetota bacterium]|jgi:hypothetical protein
MKPVDDIERLVEKIDVIPGAEMNQRTLNDIFEAQEKTERAMPADLQPDIWRIVMQSKFVKYAAAAVIIIAILIGINHLGDSKHGANIAWGQVIQRIANVDYFHFYAVMKGENGFPSIREGWYAQGKLRSRSCGGFSSYGAYQSFDDGEKQLVFDRHNNITCYNQSNLAKYENIFEAMAKGLLSFDASQFQNNTPSMAGPDFLVYDFDPPQEADWIERVSVTVGRNSLVPIQIKTYFKAEHEQWYGINHLLIFDYEEQEKPEEFFGLPTETKPPHGVGQVVLGGGEVGIELHDAPGIKKALVRLHTKFDGPAEELLIPYRERYKIAGKPLYFMEITFVLDNGYRSNTSKNCPVWLDQGTKAALGKKDTWPDGKYRNIRYTPVLRATDTENVFNLELSCWLRTRQPDL